MRKKAKIVSDFTQFYQEMFFFLPGFLTNEVYAVSLEF